MRPRNIISPGVNDLLAEIAATGFEDFVKALDKGAARAPSPVEKLKAMGQGYVAFARERPAVYQLMFGVAAPLSSERLQTAKVAAWEQLGQCRIGGGRARRQRGKGHAGVVSGARVFHAGDQPEAAAHHQHSPGAQPGDRRIGPRNRGPALNIS